MCREYVLNMNVDHFELHLTAGEPVLALTLLSSHCELSRQQLKLAMQKGALWITSDKGHTQRLRRAKKMLKLGDSLHFYFDRSISEAVITPPELVEDFADYSVWNKPYGVYSQGSKWGDHCTIARWSEQNLKPERPAFVVHRLDRATTGLILLAHSKHAAQKLSQLFAERHIEKSYRALVHGEFPSETQTVCQPIDDRNACSHFDILQYYSERDVSLVDVSIETGRKHQIRRHLAGLNYPIVGDRLHGIESKTNTELDLQLCAYRLRFLCPLTGEARAFELSVEKQP